MLYASSCILLLSACSTDKAFDNLDDIDLTVQVGTKGLTIPLGSTDRVYLTEAMDPETVDILDTIPGGNFVIQKDGEFDPTSVHVDPVTVHISPIVDPADFDFEATLPDGDLKTAVNAYLAVHPEQQNINRLSDIPGATGETSISAIKYDNLSFTADDFSFDTNDIDKGLVALRSATLSEEHSIQLTLTVTGLPDTKTEYNILLTDVLIDVPEYLKVRGEQAGHINLGTMTLHKAAGATSASTTVTRYITGVDYSDCRPGGELAVVDGKLSDVSHISINANASIDRDLTLTPADLKMEGGTVKLYTPIHIAPSVEIGDITFGAISGRFNPSIDPIHTSVDLNLGDNMDFLKDDATIDLQSPVITLHIANTCPVPVAADLLLTADNGTTISITDVDLTQPTITISRQAVASAAYNKVVANLSSLLNPIPEHIDVAITPHTDSSQTYSFNLGQEYTISGDYAVSAPLTFNALEINYDKLVENLFGSNEDDIRDITDKFPNGITGAELSFTIESAVPVTLDVDLSANNRDGVEQPSLITFSGMQTVQAGSLAASTQTAQHIVLGIPDLFALRDLIVRVHGVATNGTTLNARQYVRLSDGKLTIPQVTLDLNSDD